MTSEAILTSEAVLTSEVTLIEFVMRKPSILLKMTVVGIVGVVGGGWRWKTVLRILRVLGGEVVALYRQGQIGLDRGRTRACRVHRQGAPI